MKLTEKQLKQLIKETILEEAWYEDAVKKMGSGAIDAAKKGATALGLGKALGKNSQAQIDPELVTLAQTLASKAGSVKKAMLILKSLV